jgi:hypothetical protein
MQARASRVTRHASGGKWRQVCLKRGGIEVNTSNLKGAVSLGALVMNSRPAGQVRQPIPANSVGGMDPGGLL